MEGKSRDMVRQIHAFTSQVVELQQAINPLSAALEQLVVGDAPLAHRQLSRVRHRALRVTEESLIAGVFGMNFESAWWTKADHGFEVMLAAMFLMSGSLYVWFKRSGWL